ELAQRIRSRAERERTVLLAEAQREAQGLRGQGDADAIRIYADAFGQDPDFFAFYRSMEAYRNALGPEGTTLVLSPSNDFFRFLGNVPTASGPDLPRTDDQGAAGGDAQSPAAPALPGSDGARPPAAPRGPRLGSACRDFGVDGLRGGDRPGAGHRGSALRAVPQCDAEDAGGRTHTAASAPPNRGLDRGVCRRWNSLARTRLMARTHAAERNWPERLEMAFIDRPRPRRLRVAHEAGAESGRGAATARLGDR